MLSCSYGNDKADSVTVSREGQCLEHDGKADLASLIHSLRVSASSPCCSSGYEGFVSDEEYDIVLRSLGMFILTWEVSRSFTSSCVRMSPTNGGRHDLSCVQAVKKKGGEGIASATKTLSTKMKQMKVVIIISYKC